MQPPMPPDPPPSESMGVVDVVSASGALEAIEKRVAKKSIGLDERCCVVIVSKGCWYGLSPCTISFYMCELG
jgi:hypothetical protein